MKQYTQYGKTFNVVTPEEFEALKAAVELEVDNPDNLHLTRWSKNGFIWYCHEYLGIPGTVMASYYGMQTFNLNKTLQRIKDAAEDSGVIPSMSNKYQEILELIDDTARSLGIKGRSIYHMDEFDKEYQQWLVANEFGLPNTYSDSEEPTAYLASKILDEVSNMSRGEAVAHISKHYGVYTNYNANRKS